MNPATRLMISKLDELAASGLTYQQAAAEIGENYRYIYHFARRHSIPLLAERGRGRPESARPDDRSEDMRVRYLAGETLEQIGLSYGITRERVRQIIRRFYGLRGNDGGKSETVRKARKEFQRKRDARSMKNWGCNYREYHRILKRADKPTYSFWGQRRNAISRNIVWDLNLWQWWKIWEQSGHWAERGRGHGYCMCRLNDTGPYSIDNVYIATGIENIQDYWVNKRASLEAA